ncbi:hypothetical protein [Halomonas sp. M4R1S46]|uniref:hypothetical protein n=1 Tax=Halomonas sp. M4R1S46 TaxID=2982692 RepID=UPI0021E429B6|nr:hypothetical protein [Halomonas sp. M4R1S46]UYG08060.1 hypothetical protein OCT48_01540 [Halomonas sp. M4R1S46]
MKIVNKATGAVSRGEPRGKQASKHQSRPEAKTPSPGATSPASQAQSNAQTGTIDREQGKGSEPAPAATRNQAKNSKAVTRVFDIIKRFYASSGTPKRITEPALKKLEERTISAAQRSELLDLAQREDASLSRTVNLAFAAFEIHSNRNIKDLLLKFAVDAGREGFDLAMEGVDAWLPLTDDERPPVKELFRRYASRVQQVESSKEMQAREKRERKDKLRNLLFLSLIWQANQGWAREDDILRFLRADGVFTTSTHYPTQATEALLKAAYTQNAADFSPLGWLSRQIENTRASQASELERLGKDVERLAAERDQAQQEIAALRQERDTLLGKTGELEQRLHQERQNAQTASVHLEDDKHRLRSRVTKVLRSEVPRLEEALIALQRDPPKLHIVSPYVEETLEHLKKVLRETEGE